MTFLPDGEIFEDRAFSLDVLSKRLEALSKRIGVQIIVQHERIFRFMHRI